MKAIKYLLAGAMMIGFTAPTMAQDDKAIIDQATSVIKSKPADLKEQLNTFYKANKKNTEVLVGIGEALLEIKDTANAAKFANYALERDTKCADAYTLLGNIEVEKDNGGKAAAYFEQAIYWNKELQRKNPSHKLDPEPYKKYAVMNSAVNFRTSIEMLERLRTDIPGYPVDLQIARLYERGGKITEAIASYEKVDRSKMEPVDFAGFGLMYYLDKQFDKSMSLMKEALQKYARNESLNRIALMNAIALKNWDEGLFYGDKLFNHSDSTDLKDLDYNNYAQAYIGKGQFDEAIAMYKKCIEVSKADKEAVNAIHKEISNAYMKKGDFENSMKEYEIYLNNTSSKTVSDMQGLAEMHYKHAADLTGEAQMAEIKAADDIYAEIQEKYSNDEDIISYVLNRRGTLNAIMDPDSKQGLAKPIFEKQIQLIEPKADKGETDNKRLITAYRYMMSYALLIAENKEEAKGWADKILSLDPENTQAQAVKELK